MSGKWKEVSPSAWDNALNLLQGGTFFDTAKWQQCFSWKTQHIIYLHYSSDNKIIAGISAGIEKIGNTYIIKSPFTAPFGGLLIKKNIHISQLLCIISELKIFFLKCSVTIISLFIYNEVISSLPLLPTMRKNFH